MYSSQKWNTKERVGAFSLAPWGFLGKKWVAINVINSLDDWEVLDRIKHEEVK